jgi:hypothetical protein
MIPVAVQDAVAAIQRQLELVKLDFPDLTTRQQDQVARSRCIEEIAAANLALDMERIRHLPFRVARSPQGKGEPQPAPIRAGGREPDQR